jgi:hypothetical protein
LGEKQYSTNLKTDLVRQIRKETDRYFPQLLKKFFLVHSRLTGSGKSTYIKQMIGDRPAGRFFVNEAHQELPDAQRVMHFEFSDGMLAMGVKFWEALYLAAFFHCYLSESGRPHLGFELTDAVYFESPNIADFDLLDFPFPIDEKQRFIRLDDFPDIVVFSLAFPARLPHYPSFAVWPPSKLLLGFVGISFLIT